MGQDHSSGETSNSIDKHYRRLGLFPNDGDVVADRSYQQTPYHDDDDDDDDRGVWDGPRGRSRTRDAQSGDLHRYGREVPGHMRPSGQPNSVASSRYSGGESGVTGSTYGGGPLGMQTGPQGQLQSAAAAMQMREMIVQQNRDMATRRQNWL